MSLPIKSLALACGLAAFVIALQPFVAAADEDDWVGLKQQAFGDRPISAEDGVVVLDAP